MKLVAVLVLAAAAFITEAAEIKEKSKAVLPADCGRFVSNKFYSGNLTDFGDFPWIVLLEYDTPKGKRVSCGGVIVSSRHVLTAAHCVANLGGNWTLSSVIVGEHDTNTTLDCIPEDDGTQSCMPEATSIKVESATAHEKYGQGGRGYDLAVVKLAESLPDSDFVKAVCLPTKSPFLPQRFHVAGWGRLSRRRGSNLKLRSFLNMVDQTSCKARYSTLAKDQMCAGVGDQHPCIADSGGPLMGLERTEDGDLRMTVFGLLTMDSKFCDVKDYPGVFTQVLTHRDWILEHLK